MKNKYIPALLCAFMLASAGCSVAGPQSDSAQAAEQSQASAADSYTEQKNSAVITLNGSGASIDTDNAGVTIEGSTVKLTAAGAYTFKGTLDDGQILVNAPKEDKVDIYLDGVSITSKSSAAVRIEACDGCTIHLVENSENTVTDGASNDFSACISAKDDLTIKGKGSLTVTGNAKHAIKSSNDLRIKGGTLTIAAASAGLYGEDSVQITGGNITVTSCKDGIKAKNEEDTSRGTVTIESAEIDIQNAQGNGIEASLSVTVSSGTVKIHSLKQAVNAPTQKLAENTVSKY